MELCEKQQQTQKNKDKKKEKERLKCSDEKSENGKEKAPGCKKKSELKIRITFVDDVYKIIEYSKVYSIESLIGNTGGYMGKLNLNNLDLENE